MRQHYLISFIVIAIVLHGCVDNTDKHADSAVAHSPVSTKKKINMELLYGNWRRYDTIYTGRWTDINMLLNDTGRLVVKQREMVMGCDGVCIYTTTYRKDGTIAERKDDYGELYNMRMDTSNNTIIAFRKNRNQPADTLFKTEVTYIYSAYILQYFPGERTWTIFYKRVVEE